MYIVMRLISPNGFAFSYLELLFSTILKYKKMFEKTTPFANRNHLNDDYDAFSESIR